jgi:4-carboxymuconolactone decarboxylase
MAEDRRPARAGLEMMDAIYGEGFSDEYADSTEPFILDLADHLFGEIWNRPGLSLRDRRLLTMGAVAAFGQADLFAVHAGGALKSGDLDPDQLHEVVLHLSLYAGASNGAMVRRGALEALAKHEAD